MKAIRNRQSPLRKSAVGLPWTCVTGHSDRWADTNLLEYTQVVGCSGMNKSDVKIFNHERTVQSDQMNIQLNT